MTFDQRAKCLLAGGGVATILAIVMLGFGSTIAIDYIKTQIPLDNPNRKVFKTWQDTAHDGTSLYRKFFFYNVNNAQQVVEDHQVPDVSIVGPYVFRERQWNPEEDIYWTPEGRLGYRYHDILTFVPELSIDTNRNRLTLDDKVTVINAAFYALAHRLSMFPNVSFRAETCLLVDFLQLGTAVGDTGIFMRRSVREILFGYDEPLFTAVVGAMEALNLLKFLAKEPLVEYNMPTKFQFVWNGTLPAPSPWSGATGQRCPVWDDPVVCNRTAYATSFVWAGVDWGVPEPTEPGKVPNDRTIQSGLSTVGSLSGWAGQEKMWWWGAPETHGGDCQVFEGGTGMTYPPRMDADGTPYVYVDSIYRKMRLNYRGDTTVKGIPAKTYGIDKSETQFSANSKCYFQEYIGAFNMTPVVFAPLSVTGIMFLDFEPGQLLKDPTFPVPGWDRLALNITVDGGLNMSQYGEARRPLWETYLNVFNDAGMLLDGAARLQSNTWLKSVVMDGCPGSFSATLPKNKTDSNGNTYVSYLPETLIPIFFVSREALVSDSLAEYIRNDVLIYFTLMNVLGGIFTALAVVLLIATGYQWSRLGPKGVVAVAVNEGFEGHAANFVVKPRARATSTVNPNGIN